MGGIHSEIAAALGFDGIKTATPGMRVPLLGDSEYELDRDFERRFQLISAGLGNPALAADLVRREGSELVIYTLPYEGAKLLKLCADDHERADLAFYVNAVDPGMRERMTECCDKFAQAWDHRTHKLLDAHGANRIDMESFGPPAEGRSGKPAYDAWVRRICESAKPFFLAERHTNAGAVKFLSANMPRFKDHILFSEYFKIEHQPLIDEFLAHPEAELHPLLASGLQPRAMELLLHAKQHGMEVVGIDSAAVSEFVPPTQVDFHKRGRAMNEAAFLVILERLERGRTVAAPEMRIPEPGKFMIHGGMGHGKLGHAAPDKPAIPGLGAAFGCPTLLIEESERHLLEDTYFFTVREFDTDRAIDEGDPGSPATNKYDLRLCKMTGTWEAAGGLESGEDTDSDEDSSGDASESDHSQNPDYAYNDALGEYVRKVALVSSESESEGPESP